MVDRTERTRRADNRRYRCGTRSGQLPVKAQRQADFLTFQMIAVLLMLVVFWAINHFNLPCAQDLRRMGRMVLEGDRTVVSELVSLLPAESVLKSLKFNLPAVSGFFSAEPRAEAPETPEADAASSSAMGGAYSGRLDERSLRPPRGTTFSPLLLSAKPRVPVSGVITSAFGWRDHPLSPGSLDFHTGLDIAAPEGTAILAALPGTIEDTGFSESYGNYVLVGHENGLQTFYCHCSELIAVPGEVVRQGERLALVGKTGRVTGPHLHFEIRQNALSNDPLAQLL